MVHDAAAARAQHALAVGVVHHERDAVLLGHRGDFVQRRDVAVHAEDAVGDDEPPGSRAGLLNRAAQVRHVGVRIANDLGAAEAAGVDDAGVVEFVGKDDVVGADQRGDGGDVGHEAALEGDARFGLFEGSQFFFQLHMECHGAGDGAHRARADAVAVDGLLGRGAQAGIVGQAEVVVGAEVEQAPPVDGHPRVHGRVDGADGGVEAGLLEGRDFVVDPTDGVGVHTLLPIFWLADRSGSALIVARARHKVHGSGASHTPQK